VTRVSTAGLATLLGISERTVREYASKLIFVREGRGFFNQEASVKAYSAVLRRSATGKRGDGAAFASASEERARLAAAQADSQEMKNAVARGELISANETETTWAEIVTMARNAILATPARIAADLPHLTPFDISVVDRHLRDALTRLGGSK
jgi:phage terminase Nu1 subunit (DNA packaging protein)